MPKNSLCKSCKQGIFYFLFFSSPIQFFLLKKLGTKKNRIYTIKRISNIFLEKMTKFSELKIKNNN